MNWSDPEIAYSIRTFLSLFFVFCTIAVIAICITFAETRRK